MKQITDAMARIQACSSLITRLSLPRKNSLKNKSTLLSIKVEQNVTFRKQPLTDSQHLHKSILGAV